jgi:hypothetical protein
MRRYFWPIINTLLCFIIWGLITNRFSTTQDAITLGYLFGGSINVIIAMILTIEFAMPDMHTLQKATLNLLDIKTTEPLERYALMGQIITFANTIGGSEGVEIVRGIVLRAIQGDKPSLQVLKQCKPALLKSALKNPEYTAFGDLFFGKQRRYQWLWGLAQYSGKENADMLIAYAIGTRTLIHLDTKLTEEEIKATHVLIATPT